MPRILVVDDERGLREMLGVLFRRAGYEVAIAEGLRDAVGHIQRDAVYDAVVSDLVMPDGSGLDVLDAARRRDDNAQVVILTAHATTDRAVEAMRRGAYDYVQKPFQNAELLATLDKALEKRAISLENHTLRAQVRRGFRTGEMVGKSPAIERVMELVRRVASARSSVLITGESGTGKEVVARSLHTLGERASKPFIVVNASALPETLMESELFGHEKGAFTGATQKKEGLFRAADGGTLFLDEIGELSGGLQAKLLRVLQDRKIRAVGGEKEVEIDVRVVAATNRDVEKEVAEGRFRQDLFYRLNVIRLHLPPLRERRDDIPLLTEHFLEKHGALLGVRAVFSPDAMRWIVDQPYPGNVRELENVVERALALCNGGKIERADLPGAESSTDPAPREPQPALGTGFDLDAYLGDIERRVLERALHECGGLQTAAAKRLGVSFRSLRYRLQKYGLDAGDLPDTEER